MRARDVLLLIVVGISGCSKNWSSNAEDLARLAGTATPPNILFAIADDWSWPHAGVYGDKVVKTPVFDRLAEEGILFTHAFCAAPSCTPSRGAILTGQAIHRLEEGGNLWSSLPAKLEVYPEILEAAGYTVGHMKKGWGPGNLPAGGRERNPAGPRFGSFAEFLDTVPAGDPFCFWFGSHDPHRGYEKGSGLASGMNPLDVKVPPFLPDTPEVRSDIVDYYFEVQRFDNDVGGLLSLLEEKGLVENTIVVMTSDNGMPFPRAKANLYEAGSHMPLVIRWPEEAGAGTTCRELVSFTDFAPTFLEAAGLEAPSDMTGRSLVPLLQGKGRLGREFVFVERERHANVRKGNLSYPARAIRSHEFLYIRNFRPDRWPAGDPELYFAVGRFGDIDGSPTKSLLLDQRENPAIAPFFELATAKRPKEELYDLRRDPWQIVNVADRPKYQRKKQEMRRALERWMIETGDPRIESDDDRWDQYPYHGKAYVKPE